MSDGGPGPRFPERAGAALKDAYLQEALTIATTKFIGLRRESFSGFAQGEALRDRARAIKEATLQQLDRHLERLADSIESLGGHVHWAATGDEAREIILRLCRDRGVRMAVKSKSMATEEIELNEALERAGIRPVETDLDPEVLTAVARKELRQKFLEADMGITGANFAVAETGTVVLVTNEGNGRMVTSLPRIHVAVMGMEKVIPSMTDLMVFLAILARSATGQKLSSYTTLVRGPRQPGEMEGPEEFHLILMDNGRTRQIAGPLREALYCLRCGACLNVCPVYRQVGGHAYGHTYPGPIGILLTAMLKGNESVKDLAHASSLCGACKDVCPVRIDIPRMLIELREHLDSEKIAPWPERMVFGLARRIMTRPAMFRLGATLGRIAQRPFVRQGRLGALPLFFGKWTRTRDLPPVAARTFSERWKELDRS